MVLSVPARDQAIIILSLVLATLIFIIAFSIPLDSTQLPNSTHLKLGNIIKLGQYNESSTSSFYSSPQLSYSEPSNLYVIWRNSEAYLGRFNQTEYNITWIVMRVSNDNGASFKPLINVRNSSELYPGDIDNLTEFAAVSDSILASDNKNQTYVGWIEYPSVDYDEDVVLKRNLKNRTSFEPYSVLSNDSRHARELFIAAGENNTVFLAWNGINNKSKNVFYLKISNDAGKTFTGNSGLQNYSFGNPLIAVNGNDIYLAGYNGRSILLTKSTDLGQHFNQPVILPIHNSQFTNFRQAAGSNNSLMVWDDVFNIYFQKIESNTTTLSNNTKLTKGTQFCDAASHPDISAKNDKVYVVWAALSCDNFRSNVFLTRSLDGGKTFGMPINLSNNTFRFSGTMISSIQSYNPKVITSNNGTFVTWENKYANHGDILFLKVD
jgi:hypothetical protein